MDCLGISIDSVQTLRSDSCSALEGRVVAILLEVVPFFLVHFQKPSPHQN